MKKKLLLVVLALAIALPLAGLAADVPETPETEAPATWYGPRWRQNAPATPPTGFVDENNDGVCDNCGNTQGANPDAPGFADEDNDGVCDNLGTTQQGQGRLQMMRIRMQQMQGRMQQMQGRMQQQGRGANMQGRHTMRGRMQQQGMGRGMARGAQGNAQGPNYQDENNDGVCDHRTAPAQRKFGPGRRW